ncbi:hypothetical protein ACEZCY_12875 [Streptacidiphilus sp. N1-12]|uniref:Uncharacterized protein n=2 Tax=Streptacidiphilus alkalitolerans TaxID=3342712 RepID=A0ABV6X7T7_9ACTN
MDTLLESLDGSPAAPNQIAHQTLEAQHLGTEVNGAFSEITDLSTTYQTVHEQLQSLSKTLSDQINAMSITVQVSQVGYQHVEADQVDALWAIQTRTQATALPPGQDGLTVQQQLDAAKRAAAGSPNPVVPVGTTSHAE